jgi:hypothetical protein
MAGCQAGQPQQSAGPAKTPSPEIDDPCVNRLHDLCGPLLLYYKVKRQLPQHLEDLGKVYPGPLPPLVCPASNKPYVYDRDGLEIPDSTWRIVVYDPEPSHYGKRRVILMDPASPGHPIEARTELVPEGPIFHPVPSADGNS